jgi:hypothetical protein
LRMVREWGAMHRDEPAATGSARRLLSSQRRSRRRHDRIAHSHHRRRAAHGRWLRLTFADGAVHEIRLAGLRAAACSPRFAMTARGLTCGGREAELRIEKAVPEDWQTPRLHQSLSLNIAPRRPHRATPTPSPSGPVRHVTRYAHPAARAALADSATCGLGRSYAVLRGCVPDVERWAMKRAHAASAMKTSSPNAAATRM